MRIPRTLKGPSNLHRENELLSTSFEDQGIFLNYTTNDHLSARRKQAHGCSRYRNVTVHKSLEKTKPSDRGVLAC